MAFFDNAAFQRQQSWEQPAPPSRSGATSAASSHEPTAFSLQFEEVERAMDNLMKSGKFMGGVPGRRDSIPSASRPYGEFDARSGASSRHHSVSEYDGGRSNSAAGLQGFYAAQRFQPRQSEAEQMMQAKRRMAAQRERELRNYHQEQQYNRNTSGVKSERSMSPNNNLNEEDRRDLIARQHRALYGNDAALYAQDGSGSRPSQDARSAVSGSARGPSPLAFDPFGMQSQGGAGADSAVQMPPREQMQSKTSSERRQSTSPPSSNPPTFGMTDNAQQSSRTSASSPSASPPVGQSSKTASTGGVAPIGTRPAQTQASAPKRSNTPNERSASAASNPVHSDRTSGLGSWGSNSGVWGKNPLGVQASVWG